MRMAGILHDIRLLASSSGMPVRRLTGYGMVITALAAGSAILAAVGPVVAKHIVDSAIREHNVTELVVSGGLLIGLYLFAKMVNAVHSLQASRLHGKVLMSVKTSLLRSVLHLPFIADRRSTGEYVSRIEADGDNLVATSLRTSITLMSSLASVLAIFAFVLRLAPLAGAGFAGCFAMYLLLSWHACKRAQLLSRAAREVHTEKNVCLTDILQARELIRETNAAEMEVRRYDQKLCQCFRSTMAQVKQKVFISTTISAAMGLPELLTLSVGGYLVIKDMATLGLIMAMMIYIRRLSSLSDTIVASLFDLQPALASLDRVKETLGFPREQVSAIRACGRYPLTKAITFRQVCAEYDEGRRILSGASFAIPAGRITAVVGASGAGKTTIVRLLQGLIAPSAGKLLWDGTDYSSLDLCCLRASVGVASQNVLMFHRTLRDNILYRVPHANASDVSHARRLLCNMDLRSELVEAMETDRPMREFGSSVSGGERQRLAIARELLGDPTILIMDEATANVDSRSEEVVLDQVAQWKRDRTIVVITHRLSTMMHADHVIVLSQGAVISAGVPRKVLKSCEECRQLFADQASIVLQKEVDCDDIVV